MTIYPHCDNLILHAPGECYFCDQSPDLQQARIKSEINFTNKNVEGLAPCPSLEHRPAEIRDIWDGNKAAPDGPDSKLLFEMED